MSFLALPPEVNSGLILAGAGSQPMLAAATAWSGLSDELFTAADSFGSIVAGLTAAAWQGPAMAATALPFRNWLSAVAAEAGQAAGQANTMTALIETVRSAVVPPVMLAANRSELVSLALSNLFGQNAPSIATVEAAYEHMWAADVSAMSAYHAGAAAVASALTPFAEPMINFSAGVANSGSGNIGNANLGIFNVGSGDVGDLNLGAGNAGSTNIGFGNLGTDNRGVGNVGVGNVGFGNSGLGMTAALSNIGFGNTGSNNVGFGNSGVGNIGFGNTGPFTIPGLTIDELGFRVPLSGSTAPFTITGFSVDSLGVSLPLQGSTDPFVIRGFTIPRFDLSLPLHGSTGDVTIPGFTIPGFPLHVSLAGGLGPIEVPITIAGGPGYVNSTTAPSSGFFNSGAGSTSGVGNIGSAISGFWNQVPDSLPGGLSGYYNVGQLTSGLLNVGNTVSGVYNTSALSLLAQAFDSGVSNIGRQLSGYFFTGSRA